MPNKLPEWNKVFNAHWESNCLPDCWVCEAIKNFNSNQDQIDTGHFREAAKIDCDRMNDPMTI